MADIYYPKTTLEGKELEQLTNSDGAYLNYVLKQMLHLTEQLRMGIHEVQSEFLLDKLKELKEAHLDMAMAQLEGAIADLFKGDEESPVEPEV